MVTPNAMSKVDMSLDDIIKLGKKQRRAIKANVGKGKKQVKPGARQPSKPAEGRRPGGLARKKGGGELGIKAKQLKQKARKNLQKNRGTFDEGWTPNNNKKKNNTSMMNKSLQNPAKRKTSILGVRARLGEKGTQKGIKTVQKQSGGGRGGARGKGVKGRGGIREVQKPHNLLKAMRELKSTAGSSKRYGSADKEAFKQLAIRGGGRGVGRRGVGRRGGGSVRPELKQDNAEDTIPTPASRRGRGRGGRGKILGRGEAGIVNNEQQPSSVVASQLEPPGLDLSLQLFGDHHTSKSLNHRFTPQLEGKSMHRLVQRGGRTINYQY